MSRLLLVLLSSTLLPHPLVAEVRGVERIPVVSKLQLVFSAVSHRHSIASRVQRHDEYGEPPGNHHYAVPHLVCDPIVTLHNPYPEPITIDALQVRIWNPPVGFRFRKNDVYLRTEFASGATHGLSRFQLDTEQDPTAGKTFTLVLTERNGNGDPGAPLTLEPGESRAFAPWVEPDWNWSEEVADGGFNPSVFFDWDTERNLTNYDGRTNNRLGVETLPGWDPRAGFQTDHLSYLQRPPDVPYEFEKQFVGDGAQVSILLDDTFTVEARGEEQAPPGEPDFRLSLLSRNTQCQDFAFDISDLVSRLPIPAGEPELRRTFRVGDILQENEDPTPGGKTAFAMLSAIARSSALADGSFEQYSRRGSLDGGQHYHLLLDQVAGLHDLALPSPELVTPGTEPRLVQFHRSADTLRLALAVPAASGPWILRGGSSPDHFPDDLTGRAAIVSSATETEGMNLQLATLDLRDLGPRYFVRFEEVPGATDPSPSP